MKVINMTLLHHCRTDYLRLSSVQSLLISDANITRMHGSALRCVRSHSRSI